MCEPLKSGSDLLERFDEIRDLFPCPGREAALKISKLTCSDDRLVMVPEEQSQPTALKRFDERKLMDIDPFC